VFETGNETKLGYMFLKEKVTDERTHAQNNDNPLYIIVYINTAESTYTINNHGMVHHYQFFKILSHRISSGDNITA
jgi:hypothetical protein